MPLIGIDFGTQESKVAAARLGGIDIVTNEFSKRTTPSVVAYTHQNRESGENAANNITMNFKNTVPHVKRLIGLKYSQVADEVASGAFPCKVVQGENDEILVEVTYLEKPTLLRPVQILASYFASLKTLALKGAGQQGTDAVFAIPADYTERQRRAILTAARIAGIHVIKLTNDITAAALQYAMYARLSDPEDGQDAKPMNVAFVDVGYGATSVSVIAIKKGHIKVLSCSCDHRLGGRDFDRILLDYFIDEIQKKHGLDVQSNARAKIRLARECEKLKKVLSANTVGQLRIESFMNDVDITFMFERKEFLEMAAPLLERLDTVLKEAVADCGLSLDDIRSVEILGGASYVPAIREVVAAVFQKPVSQQLNATEAIARGCALDGALHSPSFHLAKRFEISDVVVYPIEIGYTRNTTVGTDGSENGELRFNTVFKRYEASPSKLKKLPLTHVGDLHLVARYSKPELLPPGTDPIIGKYKITGIPKDRPAKVTVYFRHTLNGLFSVESAYMTEEIEVEEKVPVVPEEKEETATSDKKDAMETDSNSPEEKENAGAEGESSATADETTGSEKSETEKKEQEPQYVTKMVKKTIKKELKITATELPEYSEAQVQQFIAEEAKMQAQDTLVRETSDARNDLETYVYYLRDNIYEGGPLGDYVDDETRDKINTALDEIEDWLYGDGDDATKEEYVKKLADIKREAAPIEQRKKEAEERSGLVETLKSTISQFKEFVGSKDEKYAHIDADERAKVAEECAKVESWLEAELTKLESQPKFVNPDITCADITARTKALQNVCRPIMNKPKPAPPKPESPPKPEADTNANASPAESNKEAANEEKREQQDEEMIDVD